MVRHIYNRVSEFSFALHFKDANEKKYKNRSFGKCTCSRPYAKMWVDAQLCMPLCRNIFESSPVVRLDIPRRNKTLFRMSTLSREIRTWYHPTHQAYSSENHGLQMWNNLENLVYIFRLRFWMTSLLNTGCCCVTERQGPRSGRPYSNDDVGRSSESSVMISHRCCNLLHSVTYRCLVPVRQHDLALNVAVCSLQSTLWGTASLQLPSPNLCYCVTSHSY
jgi:hypothetical protein